jgi:hypothetical protein
MQVYWKLGGPLASGNWEGEVEVDMDGITLLIFHSCFKKYSQGFLFFFCI